MKRGELKLLAPAHFKNNAKGFIEFLEWVKKKNKTNIEAVFLMEATGVYFENLVNFLHEKDEKASVIFPNRMKGYFKSLNITEIKSLYKLS